MRIRTENETRGGGRNSREERERAIVEMRWKGTWTSKRGEEAGGRGRGVGRGNVGVEGKEGDRERGWARRS